MEGDRVDSIRSLKFDGKKFLVYKEGEGGITNKVLLLHDILKNTLVDGIRVRLAHLTNPQAKWPALVNEFEKKYFAVGLFKRREMLNVEFGPDNESIRDSIHLRKAIRQKLTHKHEEVLDMEVVTALLTGLGETYKSMTETFDNLDAISQQQVKIKLTSRDQRQSKSGDGG
ncbi:hypothetical protein GQ600_17151 [Phytophthora cactorum]|nr:hypothetical protein GQ600_17151 [Phytophthora cactorum]